MFIFTLLSYYWSSIISLLAYCVHMLKDNIQIYIVGIVLNGDFNPTIIQPFWLAQKKLIGEKEAEGAYVNLIHKDLVRFEIDWLFLEVNNFRFELRTSKEPYFEALKDLTIGIFEYLKETPITALGINHIMHIPLRDDQQNDNLGKDLVSLSKFANFMENPKVLDLQVIEQVRKDNLLGSLTLRVAPSDQTTSKRGISININDHYSLPAGSLGRNGEISKILAENWLYSFDRANDIAENFWKNFNL
jgi:hypothetical protein